VSGNKINSIQSDTFVYNVYLEWLDLKGNYITYVHPSTFRNNRRLTHFNISGNKLTSVDLHTFSSNRELKWLDLQNNTITDIHPSTFQNNCKMEYLDLSTNLLNVTHSNTFQYNVNLKFLSLRNNNIVDINTGFLSVINPTYLDLSRNRIGYLDNSIFRKQGQLETLILSENMLQSLEPGIFSDCTNLRSLFLSANSISYINRSAFVGLELLKHLDVSNNNIEDFNPLVFELCSIISIDPTLEPVSLNVSSNRLDSLDEESVMWLKQTAAVTDLSGNPWRCECSALGEAWWELRQKLTLNCASPKNRTGRSWDVIEEDLCPDIIRPVEIPAIDKLNVSTDATHNINSDILVVTALIAIMVLTLIAAPFLVMRALMKWQQRDKLNRSHEAL
jgi:Leucine-rich repeat (LRR) protein